MINRRSGRFSPKQASGMQDSPLSPRNGILPGLVALVMARTMYRSFSDGGRPWYVSLLVAVAVGAFTFWIAATVAWWWRRWTKS